MEINTYHNISNSFEIKYIWLLILYIIIIVLLFILNMNIDINKKYSCYKDDMYYCFVDIRDNSLIKGKEGYFLNNKIDNVEVDNSKISDGYLIYKIQGDGDYVEYLTFNIFHDKLYKVIKNIIMERI